MKQVNVYYKLKYFGMSCTVLVLFQNQLSIRVIQNNYSLRKKLLIKSFNDLSRCKNQIQNFKSND